MKFPISGNKDERVVECVTELNDFFMGFNTYKYSETIFVKENKSQEEASH